jgi:hypothetical protein
VGKGLLAVPTIRDGQPRWWARRKRAFAHPTIAVRAVTQRKTRGARAFLSAFIQSDFIQSALQYGLVQAACLCIAPVAETCPRIALTERSIAAQSLPISAAARPSA